MKTERMTLIALFVIALILRLLFSFYFQQFYFGGFEFKYGDGNSYLGPILNLINNGEYRGDKFLDDSRYFRVPVYPLILGFFHLISPVDIFNYVVASMQCLLGAFSAILVYYIIFNISQMRYAGLFSGVLFAFYPFVILWTPLMYTETLQLFFMLSLLCLATNKNKSIVSIIMQGALIGLIVLTKQYMGLIIIMPVCVILFTSTLSSHQKITNISLLLFCFCLLLLPWVARNYMVSGKVIVLFGETSGLRFALDDEVAFTQFANKFDENTSEYIESVADTGKVKFPKHPEFLAAHKADIDAATLLAYQCGGSFQEIRKHTLPEQAPYQNCNQEVVLRFDELSAQFWREIPLWEALETRRDALWKVVSKSDLVNKNLSMNKSDLLKYGLLKYRIFILALGFAGMLSLLLGKAEHHQQKVLTGSLLVTAIAFYLFFCLILLSAEMRYLLTPDLLISSFAGVIPAVLFRRMLSSSKMSEIGKFKQL